MKVGKKVIKITVIFDVSQGHVISRVENGVDLNFWTLIKPNKGPNGRNSDNEKTPFLFPRWETKYVDSIDVLGEFHLNKSLLTAVS